MEAKDLILGLEKVDWRHPFDDRLRALAYERKELVILSKATRDGDLLSSLIFSHSVSFLMACPSLLVIVNVMNQDLNYRA